MLTTTCFPDLPWAYKIAMRTRFRLPVVVATGSSVSDDCSTKSVLDGFAVRAKAYGLEIFTYVSSRWVARSTGAVYENVSRIAVCLQA